jgi:hypothetical protein
MANPATLVRMVKPANPAMLWRNSNCRPNPSAELVPMVLLVRLAPRARLDLPVFRANKVLPAEMVAPRLPDPVAPPVNPVTMVPTANPALKARKDSLACVVFRDQGVLRVRLAPVVLPGLPVTLDPTVSPVPMDLQDPLDRKESLAIPALLAGPDLRVLPGPLVRMLNIVLVLVAAPSSKLRSCKL